MVSLPVCRCSNGSGMTNTSYKICWVVSMQRSSVPNTQPHLGWDSAAFSQAAKSERSGLLSLHFPCNVCRERHPSRGWSAPPRAEERITLWTQSSHFTYNKGTKFHFFLPGTHSPGRKRGGTWSSRTAPPKSFWIRRATLKSISSQVPPGFLFPLLKIFYCACGTFILLLLCEDRQCLLLDLSSKYIQNFFYVCQALLESGWAFSGRTFGTDRESK